MSAPHAAGRPLIVRIRNWVGDVILGLPALQLLQDQGYSLHLVARGKWAPALLAGHGWPVHVQPAGLQAKVAQLRQLRAQCLALDAGFGRRENALLLPVSFSSALEMKLAGLKTVGVAKEGRSLLLARSLPWATEGHELERYWDVACRFTGKRAPAPRQITFRVQAAKAEEAAALLAAHGIGGDFAMICPFAGGKAATADKAEKKWPGFEAFTQQAEARLGLPLVVYPGPGEHETARQRYGAARMLEGSDLAIYAALLQRASLVVANDTGPGHMAAALGTPLIGLLGPTEAARWAPWGPEVHVLQRPRGEGATDWPEAEEALALAQQLLGRRRA
jgi:ADP-heptose:LPS heptosyltransferase